MDSCRDRGDVSVSGGDSSLLGFPPWIEPRVLPLLCADLLDEWHRCSVTCITDPPRVVYHVNVAVDLLALFLNPYPLPSAPLPASVLLSAFFFLTAISFSVSRLQYHVGYRSHDILALYAIGV